MQSLATRKKMRRDAEDRGISRRLFALAQSTIGLELPRYAAF